MPHDSRQINKNRQVQVLLDGNPLQLPQSAFLSVATLRAELEMVALSQDRVLASLCIDGVRVDLQSQSSIQEPFSEACAYTISFSDLGHQMISAGLEQIDQLLNRIETAVCLVLINEATAIQSMLAEIENQLRSLLVLLSLLNELCRNGMEKTFVNNRSIRQHLDQLVQIQESLASGLAPCDGMVLSDVMELRLMPWLLNLRRYLEILNEQAFLN